MAEGKFISHLHAHMPLVEGARRVFAVRLEVVRQHIPAALQEADQDPEHIHQLRVSTRRAGAAARIFALCLPHRLAGKLGQKLRRLRRAAGDARDWDVFFATVAARFMRAPQPQRPGLDFLLGYSKGQRAAAQLALRAAIENAGTELHQLQTAVDKALRQPSKNSRLNTLADLALPTLTGLLRQLDEAAAQDLQPYEHLHRVRILGKRLRYAMEVFESCYDAPFRNQYYLAVEEMQDLLGHANDSYVAAQHLALLAQQLQDTQPGSCQRWQAGIQGLLNFHQRRLPKQRRLFISWWQRWRQSGAENAFATLLSTGHNGAAPHPSP